MTDHQAEAAIYLNTLKAMTQKERDSFDLKPTLLGAQVHATLALVDAVDRLRLTLTNPTDGVRLPEPVTDMTPCLRSSNCTLTHNHRGDCELRYP